MVSILQNEKVCYRCGTPHGLHLHHIFQGTGNRRISDENGFTIWLCGYHHNLSDDGIHFNKEYDHQVKQECQAKFEETHTREEFMSLIGRNFLEVKYESRSKNRRDGDSAEEWLHGISL